MKVGRVHVGAHWAGVGVGVPVPVPVPVGIGEHVWHVLGTWHSRHGAQVQASVVVCQLSSRHVTAVCRQPGGTVTFGQLLCASSCRNCDRLI